MNIKYDVIIIGAGAAGLTAAKDLLSEGYRVCLLEAASIPGGRITSDMEDGFDDPIETGAEFIHGEMPYTFKLLKETNTFYEEVEGRMVAVQKGIWLKEEQDEHWNEFMRKLDKLKEDCSVQQFLDENFPKEKYASLHRSVQNFAEGFDLADISKASILSLKNDWKSIDSPQYRIKGGYSQLINYLYNCCHEAGAAIYFNVYVNRIEYSNGNGVVFTSDERKFQATRVVVTISVGMLQSASIEFKPSLTLHDGAIKALGFGSVIKVLLWFKTRFWKKNGDDIGFLLTDEEIPTWWTQLPVENNLLTGWLGGPRAAKKSSESDESILQSALRSLSSVFHVPVDTLQNELIQHKTVCWQNEPYIKGGYSYNTVQTDEAKKILAKPVDETIFFAGEAIPEGELTGTVESALQSGHEVAEMMLKYYLTKKTVAS